MNEKGLPHFYGKPSRFIYSPQTTFWPTVLTPCVFMMTMLAEYAFHT
jgi:hypothetical protein